MEMHPLYNTFETQPAKPISRSETHASTQSRGAGNEPRGAATVEIPDF